VLTGDKEETAINIAVACNLVLPKQFMDHIVVNNTVAPDDASMRKLFIEEIKVFLTTLFCQYFMS
jgi:magnesium-transporting ATPase (P-type)